MPRSTTPFGPFITNSNVNRAYDGRLFRKAGVSSREGLLFIADGLDVWQILGTEGQYNRSHVNYPFGRNDH